MRLREPAQIQLPVTDPSRSKRFYKETLGIKADKAGALWMGEVELALLRGTPFKSSDFRLRFRVESRDEVREWRRVLEKKGQRVLRSADEGDHAFVAIADPDGYEIEIAFEALLGMTEPNPMPVDE